MHIALIGAMGSGKTTIGTLLAKRLGRPYLDNDDRLRAVEGTGPAQFEEQHGLAALHAAEAALLVTMLESPQPAVIAAAASTIEDAACRDALARQAFTVWLRVSPEHTAASVRAGDRPRTGETFEALVSVAVGREPAYAAAADLVVEQEAVDPEEAVALIVQAFSALP